MSDATLPAANRVTVSSDESRFRQILDGAHDTIIAALDLSGCVTSWNEGARRLTGYTSEEAIGRPLDFIFAEDDRLSGLFERELEDVLEHGHLAHDAWRVRKNGSRYWSTGQITLLRDDDGNPTGFLKIARDRSADRRVAEDLRDTEEQLRFAQTAGGIGTFILDPATHDLKVTPEFCRMFGLPVAPVVASADVARCLLPEDLEASSTPESRADGTAAPRSEFRIRRADDGRLRWIARSAHFSRNERGAVTRMLGITQDITESKLLEEGFRDTETRFRNFAKAIPNQLWTAAADGNPYWASDNLAQYTGISVADGCSFPWTDIIHPDDFGAAQAAWRQALEKRDVYEAEMRVRRTDGVYRWHLTRAVPVADGVDGLVWIGANTDIEEQRSALAALESWNDVLEGEIAERTADLDRIWSLTTDLMLVATTGARIIAVNPAWKRLLGWSEESLRGRELNMVVHPDDIAASGRELERLATGQISQKFENRILDRHGGFRIIAWTAVPGGGLVHAVGRDVTAERTAAAELEQAQDALRQAQKMEAIGQLTGGIAHDFNNLLTGITGSLDMMQRRLAQGRTAEVERYVSTALGAAQRAASLTHRLLAFSRRQPLDSRPVDANRLLGGMQELLERTLGEAISLEFGHSADLWLTVCDPHQLENAVLNLVINARDAMANGGSLSVTTSNVTIDDRHAQPELGQGDYVCIAVSDTGEGIAAETLSKVFDPFFTTKPLGQGTGLGLSMIHGFARQSGGTVSIVSRRGEGTTVRLFLPRRDAELHESAGDDQPAPGPASVSPGGAGETILVIEDEPPVRGLVVDLLRDLGYEVMAADDGPSGLALIHSDAKIDLLLTDIGLPHLSGRHVAESARRVRPDLKVLFMTGYAGHDPANYDPLHKGMKLITKPFSLQALTDCVRAMLDEDLSRTPKTH